MMIVMKPTASEDDIAGVIDKIESVGARAHPSRGEEVTVIGAVGDLELGGDVLGAHPGVDEHGHLTGRRLHHPQRLGIRR